MCDFENKRKFCMFFKLVHLGSTDFQEQIYIYILASHHIVHRQHSPGGQGVRSLRVVIPGSMNNSGLQPNDEITYNEVFLCLEVLFEPLSANSNTTFECCLRV